MQPIITSLLETDAYKFSMGQAIYHQFSDYKTTWSFKCRNEGVKFTPEMIEEIKRQIRMYCGLRFKEDELEYLNNIRWLKGSYIDFLRLWHPRFEDFHISEDDECGLSIETTGTWLNTSMYEIPTLAIVNEVYFRMQFDYDELIKDFEIPVIVQRSCWRIPFSFITLSSRCANILITDSFCGTENSIPHKSFYFKRCKQKKF